MAEMVMLQLQTKDKSLSQHFIERPASQNKNTPFARGVLLAERAGFEPANLLGYTLSKRAR